jgi:hypothetical protein
MLSAQLELLSAHAIEADRFGAAEKFFYELSRVPGFAVRVEAMLQVGSSVVTVMLLWLCMESSCCTEADIC